MHKRRSISLSTSLGIVTGMACALATLTVVPGCNRSNPYLTPQGNGLATSPAPTTTWFGSNFPQLATAANPQQANVIAMQQRYESRETELSRRLQVLDDNNRQLQTQLAQTQQQVQLANDESSLLKRHLQDVGGQLQQSRLANANVESELRGFSEQVRSSQLASQSRGSARLTANSSLRDDPIDNLRLDITPLRGLGFPVAEDGATLRLRIPADQLFEPNSAKLSSSSAPTLDRFAQVVQRSYPRQRIAVEAHCDSAPIQGGIYSTPQQLTAAQSTAVIEQLVRRNQIAATQIFSLSQGANQPTGDNSTPLGRSQNRRIEFIIYPETSSSR